MKLSRTKEYHFGWLSVIPMLDIVFLLIVLRRTRLSSRSRTCPSSTESPPWRWPPLPRSERSSAFRKRSAPRFCLGSTAATQVDHRRISFRIAPASRPLLLHFPNHLSAGRRASAAAGTRQLDRAEFRGRPRPAPLARGGRSGPCLNHAAAYRRKASSLAHHPTRAFLSDARTRAEGSPRAIRQPTFAQRSTPCRRRTTTHANSDRTKNCSHCLSFLAGTRSPRFYPKSRTEVHGVRPRIAGRRAIPCRGE